MNIRILTGDALTVLRTLPDQSVHCICSSPPYFMQRRYLALRKDEVVDAATLAALEEARPFEMGQEDTPEAFAEALVAVFHEARRVLRDDGTFWLNIGDTAASGGRGGGGSFQHERAAWEEGVNGWRAPPAGLARKDIIGIPWRLAFALQADGWILRSEIIWSKPNAFPESVADRPTKAHEQIFMFSKTGRYFYDFKAIMEPSSPNTHARAKRGRSDTHKHADGGPGNQTLARMPPSAGRLKRAEEARPRPGIGKKSTLDDRHGRVRSNESFNAAIAGEVLPMRNKRSVWEVPTAQYSDSHYATFPPALIEPIVLAACPRGGIILDPFAGSGTVGQVADRHGRGAVLIDLDPRNVRMMEGRLRGNQHALPLTG